jgi:hypothetical protein
MGRSGLVRSARHSAILLFSQKFITIAVLQGYQRLYSVDIPGFGEQALVGSGVLQKLVKITDPFKRGVITVAGLCTHELRFLRIQCFV